LSFSWIHPASFSPWQRAQFCSSVSGCGNRTASKFQRCAGALPSRSSPASWHSPQGISGCEKSNLWSWIVYRVPPAVVAVWWQSSHAAEPGLCRACFSISLS
jgi:hypothetical protein